MALAKEMGVPFLGQIPIDPEVVTVGDAGIPLVRDGPQSPAAKAFTLPQTDEVPRCSIV